jgi:hypothetical protein
MAENTYTIESALAAFSTWESDPTPDNLAAFYAALPDHHTTRANKLGEAMVTAIATLDTEQLSQFVTLWNDYPRSTATRVRDRVSDEDVATIRETFDRGVRDAFDNAVDAFADLATDSAEANYVLRLTEKLNAVIASVNPNRDRKTITRRDGSSITFADLVDADVIPVGSTLTMTYRGTEHAFDVQMDEDGSAVMVAEDGSVFDAPSPAAQHVAGEGSSRNGWADLRYEGSAIGFLRDPERV